MLPRDGIHHALEPTKKPSRIFLSVLGEVLVAKDGEVGWICMRNATATP